MNVGEGGVIERRAKLREEWRLRVFLPLLIDCVQIERERERESSFNLKLAESWPDCLGICRVGKRTRLRESTGYRISLDKRVVQGAKLLK